MTKVLNLSKPRRVKDGLDSILLSSGNPAYMLQRATEFLEEAKRGVVYKEDATFKAMQQAVFLIAAAHTLMLPHDEKL